jgi:hypothetical protein
MPSGKPGTRKTYNCLYCDKENYWGYSISNKFCNNQCQAQYKWENETKPRIERGEVVNEGSPCLKRYLIEKFGEKCSECPTGNVWNNKPLVLQLDHIDGDSDNNYPTNLRLLCPNCHTQTDNFGCKGQGNRYKKIARRNRYLQEYKASLV